VLAASIIRAIIAVMMEATSTSETSVNFYQSTRLNNPEDSHLQTMIIFLNSINQLIFVMMTGCVFFAVRTEYYLNIIWTNFGSKGLILMKSLGWM
jgi:hypothetical protein